MKMNRFTKEELVAKVEDAIDKEIDDLIHRTRREDGIEMYSACFDRGQLDSELGKDLREAIRTAHNDDLAGSGFCDRNGNLLARSLLFAWRYPKYERITDYLKDAYAEPGERVDDWVRRHMGGSVEGWVKDFLTDPTSHELEPEWQDLSNWDVNGAVGSILASLLDLAQCGDLVSDDAPVRVLGNGEHYGDFYTYLMDDFYTDPDADEIRQPMQ